MTDINKQIEEEAREYRDREFQERIVRANSNFDSVDIEMAFRNGYKSCLHSSRWRKVSEGMPEVEAKILAKDINGNAYTAFLGIHGWVNSERSEYVDSRTTIVEWKYID